MSRLQFPNSNNAILFATWSQEAAVVGQGQRAHLSLLVLRKGNLQVEFVMVYLLLPDFDRVFGFRTAGDKFGICGNGSALNLLWMRELCIEVLRVPEPQKFALLFNLFLLRWVRNKALVQVLDIGADLRKNLLQFSIEFFVLDFIILKEVLISHYFPLSLKFG